MNIDLNKIKNRYIENIIILIITIITIITIIFLLNNKIY